ncbi:hypothetical protein BD626DRAFT_625658 [Schizophyllum amplum]|uniref:Uncharacterized protein n=1 Tax=Schizophyllum amplum TaxID=97359 RepID=A0A550D0C2_9AGAR|nr:hypothetical protein BD626DRAFT_625658 [Auriculariopsis ampla]
MPRNENLPDASVDDVPDTSLAAQVAALARHGLYCRIRSRFRRIAGGTRHTHNRLSPAREQQLGMPDSRPPLRLRARYCRQATENRQRLNIESSPSTAPVLPAMDLPGPIILSDHSSTSLGRPIEESRTPSPQVTTNDHPFFTSSNVSLSSQYATQGRGRTPELRALRRDLADLRDAIMCGLAILENDPHTAGVRTLDIEESTCAQVLSSRLGHDDVTEEWQTVPSAVPAGEGASGVGVSGLYPPTQDAASLSGLGLYLATTDDQAIPEDEAPAPITSSHSRVNHASEASVAAPIVNEGDHILSVRQPSGNSKAAVAAATVASHQQPHTEVTDSSYFIPTLVGLGKASLACAGGLELIIDVGTTSEVENCPMILFWGDLDNALEQLPDLCEPYTKGLTQLFMRLRRSRDRQDYEIMNRVMLRLEECLFGLFAIHIIMDEKGSLGNMDQDTFLDCLPHLRYLRIEGQATRSHFMLFPLHNLRQLDIMAKTSSNEVMELIHQAKMLDVLLLDFYDGVQTQTNIELGHDLVPHDVRFPPAMHITADNPTALLPCFVAALSTTTDLRLTVTGHECPAEVAALFVPPRRWFLDI